MFKDMSLKWKVLLIAALGPIIVAAINLMLENTVISDMSIRAIVEKSKAIVMMAEAGREEMAHKLEVGIIKPFDEIPADVRVNAVPVITRITSYNVCYTKLLRSRRGPARSACRATRRWPG